MHMYKAAAYQNGCIYIYYNINPCKTGAKGEVDTQTAIKPITDHETRQHACSTSTLWF